MEAAFAGAPTPDLAGGDHGDPRAVERCTMRGQHLFFATRADLLPGLALIESRRALEYQRHELRDDPAVEPLSSLTGMPGLGVSRTGQMTTDDGYLVYPRDARPALRPIPQRRGGLKYEMHLSPEVVQFQPAGLHLATGALVAGRIARVVGANLRGRELYTAFAQAVLAGFRPVRGYWLGPEADRAFRDGRRLATIGVRSPAAYDLTEERRP